MNTKLMLNELIQIDGSFGEGGGQILRTALALSALTKKPCHIFNIRKNRPKPGLATQHLLGIQTLNEIYQGKLEGDELGSEEIWFYPGEIQSKDIQVKIETAGSITLVLQTLILPCLQSSSLIKISFRGGATDTFFSPSIDHFRYVFLKILEKMGGKVEVDIERRGYYPEGGATVKVTIHPSKLSGINLIERGSFEKIRIISGASEFLKQKRVAERQIAGAREVLGKFKLPIEEKIEYYLTSSPGSQINIIGEFERTVIGIDNLGKLGKSAEEVGKEAAENFLKEGKSNGALDKHSADQILPFLALVREKSSITVSEITQHCKTNIWVIEKFTQHRNEISGAGLIEGKFKIKDNLISWIPGV